MTERDRFLAELDAEGEAQVRANLAEGAYTIPEEMMVDDWLRTQVSSRLREEVNAEQDRLGAAAQAKWDAEQALSERSVRAAETQAIYAKRAYVRSNIAIGVSIAAIVVSGFFALLDFLKP